MPIYKELSNIHLLTQWRSGKSVGGANNTLSFDKLRSRLTGASAQATEFQLVEASEYIKRICEHFKTF